jgi:uncharacterized protein (TIGR02453 family)
MNSIPKSTFTFLNKLENNNNREWFAANKETYQKEHDQIKEFYQSIYDGMQAFDVIEDMRVHRIYRDIRFSKDKTPYKTHFSGGFTRAGKFRRGGYYLHLQPGNSFLAGGFWGPNKEDLARIRQEIDIDVAPLLSIMKKPTFKKTFGSIQGEALKTAPRGYPKDHSHVDLLRMKQYYFMHNFTNEEVHGTEFKKKVLATFKLLIPYFDYMSEVLSTDMNGELIQ